MSAPCSSGFWPSGVANVLSTTERTPAARAAASTAGRSATSSIGLVGDSARNRSAPSSAATTASVSAMSTYRSVTPCRSEIWRASTMPA